MRLKLLIVNLPVSFNEMARPLQDNSYEELEGNSKGFEIYENSKDRLSARFIDKKVEAGVIIGPFGGEERVVSISFDYFEFVAWPSKDNKVYFLVKNPPRSIKSFLYEMHNIFGFGFYASETKLSVLSFVGAIGRIKGSESIKISKVRVGGVTINSKSSASIEVSSSHNALKDVESFLGEESFIVEKVKIETIFNGYLFKVEVSRSGVISAPHAFFDYMGDEIREVVAGCCESKVIMRLGVS